MPERSPRKTGFTYTAARSTIRAAHGSEWEGQAEGVAVVSDRCRFLIAPKPVSGTWNGGYFTDVPGLTVLENWRDARLDFDGRKNTAALIRSLDTGSCTRWKSRRSAMTTTNIPEKMVSAGGLTIYRPSEDGGDSAMPGTHRRPLLCGKKMNMLPPRRRPERARGMHYRRKLQNAAILHQRIGQAVISGPRPVIQTS